MIRSLVILLLCSAGAQAAPPTLTHLFPAGGVRGSKVIVTCSGTFSWADIKIWSPGIKATPLKDSGKLELEIPGNLATDRFWLRLYNSEGASAVVPFLVGDIPEINETEPNNKPADTKPVSLPVLINGALTKGEVDGFTVNIKKDQTLVAALDANNRLGSPMDAVLQVVSPAGKVVAENHDDLGLDPRLGYTAKADGNHIVRVFAFPSAPDSNIGFFGNATSVYRLTLTTGPYATHAIPLAVPAGQTATVEPRGWNIPMGSKAQVINPPITAPAEHSEGEGLSLPAGTRACRVTLSGIAGQATVWSTPLPTSILLGKGPEALSIPGAVTGQLTVPLQRNAHTVAMKKGQRLLVMVQGRSLGSIIDPVIRWIDPMGKVVTEVDDSGSNPDPTLTVAASVDGNYTLQVTDRFGHGGEKYRYLLTVRPEPVEFQLDASADSVVTTKDKPGELTVKIARKGPVGPITIKVEGLPAGVTAPETVSDTKGPTATSVTLKFTTDGKPYSGPITIVGRAATPAPLSSVAHVPARMGVELETIWLTSVAPASGKK